MKRDYVSHEKFSGSGGSFSSDKAKMKMWASEADDAAEDDELFAVLGYNVRSSDMAEVALKIQQIEMAMGSAPQDGLSQLASDAVYYNPSDLSSLLESMLSGLNPLLEGEPTAGPFVESSSAVSSVENRRSELMAADLDFGSDLISIPGKAVYPRAQPPPQLPPENPPQPRAKKLKTSPCLGDSAAGFGRPGEGTRSLLVDSQDNGIRLVHTLMACAEAVQQENFKLAEALVKNIGVLAVSQAGAMGKVAMCFAEALARRIYKFYPTDQQDSSIRDKMQMHFFETCPYLKFAHFTANQAIFEAFAGKKRVHVIDFSMKQGMQWPPLLQALATREGGAPIFRLTGIGPPSHDNTDHLQEVGFKLAQFAKDINVQFDYRGIVSNSLADLDASVMDIREGETVAVNSIFDLHQSLAEPGAIDKVLKLIRDLKPGILTVVEQEANHNGSVFLDRFTEALHYYSSLFDSLESNGGDDNSMSELLLGQQICNVVACEGVDRIERHETAARWISRFGSAGFEPVHLGSNVYKQAIMILAFSGGDGYSVEESNGCLMLGWHNRPLIAASAWRMCRTL